MKNVFWLKKGFIALLVLLIAGFLILWGAGAFQPRDPYEVFASCLSDSGLVMYGTDRCAYCNEQKQMFGDAFESIEYVNCDFNYEACERQGVIGYPSWYLNNTFSSSGLQTFSMLSAATGCSVPE